MRSYKTIAGDIWDFIALRQLGSEFHMSELLSANRQYVDIVIFPAGIVLTIPDVDPQTANTLPPWKRTV